MWCVIAGGRWQLGVGRTHRIYGAEGSGRPEQGAQPAHQHAARRTRRRQGTQRQSKALASPVNSVVWDIPYNPIL